jgi:hypothetical protein
VSTVGSSARSSCSQADALRYMPKSTRGGGREVGFATADGIGRGATRTDDGLGNAAKVGSGEAVSIGVGARTAAGLWGAARVAAAEDAVSAPDGIGGHASSPAAGSRPRSAAGVADGVTGT